MWRDGICPVAWQFFLVKQILFLYLNDQLWKDFQLSYLCSLTYLEEINCKKPYYCRIFNMIDRKISRIIQKINPIYGILVKYAQNGQKCT